MDDGRGARGEHQGMIFVPLFQIELGEEIVGDMETDPGAGAGDGQAEDFRDGKTIPRVAHV